MNIKIYRRFASGTLLLCSVLLMALTFCPGAQAIEVPVRISWGHTRPAGTGYSIKLSADGGPLPRELFAYTRFASNVPPADSIFTRSHPPSHDVRKSCPS